MFSISTEGYELVLAPELGGSIASLTYNGCPLLRGSENPSGPLECGCFPLVPYCNRIRGGRFLFRGREVVIEPNMAGDPSPLHGEGWLAPWRVDRQDASSATLLFSHESGEWPWAFDASQAFHIDADGVSAEMSCTNRSSEPMPCGLGFHPYFLCGADTRIDTAVEQVWEVDAKVLPTGIVPATGRYALNGQPACARDLDNGYGGWGGELALTYGDGAVVRMTSPDARFFQIYSPPTGGLLAAEPVSHANAALNEPEERWRELGLSILEPGETARLRMHLGIELRRPD